VELQIGLLWFPLNWIMAHRNSKKRSRAASMSQTQSFFPPLCGPDLTSS
jgi:hypothetical protein